MGRDEGTEADGCCTPLLRRARRPGEQAADVSAAEAFVAAGGVPAVVLLDWGRAAYAMG
eukprot:gene52042-17873_t